jgi:phosphotransferase system enzyme I (PtsI)
LKEFSGKTVFPGIALGPVYVLKRPELSVHSNPQADSPAELAAFESAKCQADKELEALYEKTLEELGENEADIIDVQRMMLQDGDFLDAVENYIKNESYTAVYAVTLAGRRFSEFFANLDDPYMRSRAADISDISRRITGILAGIDGCPELDCPSVVVSDDISPSETLQLDRKHIRAFVTCQGSSNSHTAILAGILKIPSIVQARMPLDDTLHGKQMAVDGHTGKIYLEPDDVTLMRLKEKQKNDEKAKQELEAVRGLPSVTKDGRKIELAANIGSVDDLAEVLAGDAEGVGLFRSEFLYLSGINYPGEEQQFNAYRTVAEALKGKRVIIRTMDIGSDKQADYFCLEKEENPALGYRAIRLCFDRPEIFRTQLRAIYRASAYGKIAVMFPMITSLWEFRRCKELAIQIQEELKGEGIPVGNVELGIMIETPAAALCSEDFAGEVDFFSVGTNDLTQYTLAVDRQNAKLEPFLNTHHPALVKLLRMVAENAHKAGIWAGICGELAADTEMLELFLKMGYSELSVSPAYILGLRKRIREIDFSDRLNVMESEVTANGRDKIPY